MNSFSFYFPNLRELATVSNDNSALGLVLCASGGVFDFLDNIHPFDDLTEDNVLVVQPSGLHSANEELAAIGVGSSIGHGQNTLASVLHLEVLIVELAAVDGFATSAVALGEVTSLNHELGNDTVEATALVVEGLASLAKTFLASAKSTEVLSSLGDLKKKKQTLFNKRSKQTFYQKHTISL